MRRLKDLGEVVLSAALVVRTFYLPSFAQGPGSQTKPNMLVIMGDDIGY
jgi:hypothetical protein